MTVAYSPTWDSGPASPELGEELIDSDLCDIVVHLRDGRRVYCQEHAVFAAKDVTRRIRILCAEHTALYFPTN